MVLECSCVEHYESEVSRDLIVMYIARGVDFVRCSLGDFGREDAHKVTVSLNLP